MVRRRGKVWCGVEVGVHKDRCPTCNLRGGLVSFQPCPRCGGALRPWCESLVNPGERCKYHKGQERHPDCPETTPDITQARLAATLRGLQEEERQYVAQLEAAPITDVQGRLAVIQAVKATASNEPQELQNAANTAQMVVRTKLMEVQARLAAAQLRQVEVANRRDRAGVSTGGGISISIVDYEGTERAERVTTLAGASPVGSPPAPEADAPGPQES